MPYLIPDDWDGTSYREYKLIWADSSQWLSVLTGQLSALSFPSIWEGETLEQEAAGAVGQELIDLNSVTGLYPGELEEMVKSKTYAVGMPPNGVINNEPIPVGSELIYAVGNSFNKPSNNFTYLFRSTVIISSTLVSSVFLTLADVNSGSIIAQANLPTPVGQIWMTFNISGRVSNFASGLSSISPYVSIRASLANKTITYPASPQPLETSVLMTFDDDSNEIVFVG